MTDEACNLKLKQNDGFKEQMHKVKFLLVLFGWLWLAGCTPDYNWRELTVADDRAVVAFPARNARKT